MRNALFPSFFIIRLFKNFIFAYNRKYFGFTARGVYYTENDKYQKYESEQPRNCADIAEAMGETIISIPVITPFIIQYAVSMIARIKP